MSNIKNKERIVRSIENWFEKEGRTLPWRADRAAYRVWVSEIMLQQTQVIKVVDYFNRFMARFPSVIALAGAPEDEVMSHWSGLGYYSRCRNLHAAAKKIVNEHQGVFPSNVQEILALPGVGSYTAGAILAFAFNQPAAVVDGNIARVLTRIYGDSTPIDSANGKKHFEGLSLQLVQSATSPRIFQEGLMELGALICKPRSPLCDACPINEYCHSKEHGDWQRFPVKKQKAPKKEMHAVFAIMGDKDHIWLEKGENGRLFRGLYAPPHQYIDDPQESKSALIEISKKLGFMLPRNLKTMTTVVRELTHRTFYLHGYVINKPSEDIPAQKCFNRSELSQLGISSAIRSLLGKTGHLFFLCAIFSGCSAHHGHTVITPAKAPPIESNAIEIPKEKIAPWRKKVLEAALAALGKKRIVLEGFKFRRDCSGTVRGIFEVAGKSLKKAISRKRQSDSKTLYDYFEAEGEISDKNPEIGDVVFFHNTYDANRDGKFNDKFTHVGVVSSVSDEGDVRYIHYGYSGIIREAGMSENLRRRRVKGSTGKELFAGYGKFDKARE